MKNVTKPIKMKFLIFFSIEMFSLPSNHIEAFVPKNTLWESESEIVYFFHKKYIVIHIKYIKLVIDYEKNWSDRSFNIAYQGHHLLKFYHIELLLSLVLKLWY